MIDSPKGLLNLGRLLPLLVLALIASATASAADAHQLDNFAFPSEHVNPLDEPGFSNPNRPSELRVNVLLPEGFDRKSAAAKRGYPVLFLLHGANGYHRTWVDHISARETTADFPGIIVMPDGGVFGMYSDWNNRGEFGKPEWMSYHLNQLIGEVERRYPIREGRRWHAIVGVSMGGMGAIRYASARPGYFGSAGAISGAALNTQLPESIVAVNFSGASIGQGATFEDLWGPADGFYATANNPQRLIPNLRHSRVFITSGDGTLCPGDPLDTDPGELALESILRIHADAYVAEARETGVDVTTTHPCGGHTYPTTRRGLEDALRWGLFEEVPADPRTWTYKTAARSGNMFGFDFQFDGRPSTVVTFERSGETLSGTGAGKVRVRMGRSCDFEMTLPGEASVKDCRPDRKPVPPAGKATLKLNRKGSVLRLRSTRSVVRRVNVKLFRLTGKAKRRLVANRNIGQVGTKARKLRVRLRKGNRYLVVARGKDGTRTVGKKLRFRTGLGR